MSAPFSSDAPVNFLYPYSANKSFALQNHFYRIIFCCSFIPFLYRRFLRSSVYDIPYRECILFSQGILILVSSMIFYAIRELFWWEPSNMEYYSILFHSYIESFPNSCFSCSVPTLFFRLHDYNPYGRYTFLIWNVSLYRRFLIMHSSILNFSPIQKHILSHIESFSLCIISYLECLIWSLHLVNKIFPFLYGMVFTVLPLLYRSVSSGLPPRSSYRSFLILNSFCIYVFPI